MSTFPIIEKLGGRQAVIAGLLTVGGQITRDQVRMWESRGRIPGDAQVQLMRLAEQRRISFLASDFDPSSMPAGVRS